MWKYNCSINCAIRETTCQGKVWNCVGKFWAQWLEGFSNYIQVSFARDTSMGFFYFFIFIFSGGQWNIFCWYPSGQALSYWSAKCLWEACLPPWQASDNTPPSLTHPQLWNQPERLPLLSELLWELVVLKSCDWLCGNLLANPSATR